MFPLYAQFLKRAAAYRDAIGQDNVRLPLQTITAVLLAYGWMRWQQMPDLAWGAFSALFVVRATVEGTVGEAAARILAAFAVLPLSARHSMRYNLAASLQLYGELLVEWAAALNEGRERPRPRDKPALERAHWRAIDMARQSRSLPIDFVGRDTQAQRLQERIEELWLTVPLMERVGGVQVTENVSRRLGPALHAVAQAAQRQIDGLAHAIRDRGPDAPLCCTSQQFALLDAVVQEAASGGGFTCDERAAVDLIRWSWHEVTRELDALCDTVQPAPQQAPFHTGA